MISISQTIMQNHWYRCKYAAVVLSFCAHPPRGGKVIKDMRDQDYLATHRGQSSGSIHGVSLFLSVARSLAVYFHRNFSSLIFSTVHINSPRRVRETRVVAVTIAAAGIVILLWMLLTILIIRRSRTWRMLDHRVEPLVHASHSHCTSRSAVRGDVVALPLGLRKGSLCRWAEGGSERCGWNAGGWA